MYNIATKETVDNWHNFTAVKKGDIGEAIVRDYLTEQGFIIYQPYQDNIAHPFDFLIFSDNKSDATIIDVKTKELMIRRPETGFPINNYKEYISYQNKYNIPVMLLFVDYQRKEIYGNYLDTLNTDIIIDNIQYPYYDTDKYNKNFILFHYKQMEVFKILTDEQSNNIKELSFSSYK